MIRKGFREILTEFEDDDLLLLISSDPYFLHDFCYMISLEIQLDKEAKSKSK
jgi:hypothetical protein|tara:strand:+ start:933 stop:1088 length:156 start_codon:yes stop_codon:yes gene_type:complete